jgi:hypothetical protein
MSERLRRFLRLNRESRQSPQSLPPPSERGSERWGSNESLANEQLKLSGFFALVSICTGVGTVAAYVSGNSELSRSLLQCTIGSGGFSAVFLFGGLSSTS